MTRMDPQIERKKCFKPYLSVNSQLDEFYKRLDEKISQAGEELKVRKMLKQTKNKNAQDMKLRNELQERLDKLTGRTTELERVCANFQSHLTIADSDKKRLESARELFQISKELTGIRFDFSAAPNVVKGYIKSESQKRLQPFEMPRNDSGALWALIQDTVEPQQEDKEAAAN